VTKIQPRNECWFHFNGLAATDGSITGVAPEVDHRFSENVDSWSGTSADRCPIYRSIHSAIDIMTAYELLPTDVLGRQVIEAAKILAIERSRSPLNSSADC
jgi:hypothetical protein